VEGEWHVKTWAACKEWGGMLFLPEGPIWGISVSAQMLGPATKECTTESRFKPETPNQNTQTEKTKKTPPSD